MRGIAEPPLSQQDSRRYHGVDADPIFTAELHEVRCLLLGELDSGDRNSLGGSRIRDEGRLHGGRELIGEHHRHETLDSRQP